MNENQSLNLENNLKEFRLFSDFPEFEDAIEQHLKAKYPQLSWLITLKKTLENSSSTAQLQNLLEELLIIFK